MFAKTAVLKCTWFELQFCPSGLQHARRRKDCWKMLDWLSPQKEIRIMMFIIVKGRMRERKKTSLWVQGTHWGWAERKLFFGALTIMHTHIQDSPVVVVRLFFAKFNHLIAHKLRCRMKAEETRSRKIPFSSFLYAGSRFLCLAQAIRLISSTLACCFLSRIWKESERKSKKCLYQMLP